MDDFADDPVHWLLYFPIGVLMVTAVSFIIFVSWPMYLLYRLGKWTIYILGED